ncbi:hypothetical protein WG66_012825 [Moniliophthora roreri]|nr:hypothetical protein WG66_012825 [Moniliophthora roreri]
MDLDLVVRFALDFRIHCRIVYRTILGFWADGLVP